MIPQTPPAIEIQVQSAMKQKSSLVDSALDATGSMRSRWQAWMLAAELGALQSSHYQRAFRSKEWFVRNFALLTLAKENPTQARDRALQILAQDPALVVRSAAVKVLQQHSDRVVREALWSEFHRARNQRKGQSLWIRGQILEVLAQKPERPELARFAKLMENPEIDLRKLAARAIQSLQSASASTL